MTTVAVIGPGAIGGTIAAWLAQDGTRTVELCARTSFDGLVVETPRGTIAASPRILTDPRQAQPVDWVAIATKTYDLEGTARWLEGLVADRTRVAVLQNGVEHVERFAPYVPAARLVPVVVNLPAERRAPGRIRQRRDGALQMPDTEAGAEFASFFATTPIVASVTADFRSAAWRKLCLNAAGAVSALVQRPAGIAARDDVADILRALVEECAAVGRAEGAVLPDDIGEVVVAEMRASPADAVNSMQADRQAKRRMELDARNGVIVRLGRRHGIATPVNAMIVTLLDAASGGA